MVACGEYQALVAASPTGEIGAGIIWLRSVSRTVECFGPYVFCASLEEKAAIALLEGCIGAVARTPVVGLINYHPTQEFPREQFEHLGRLSVITAAGTRLEHDAWFRLLHEDPGCVVWAHKDLQGYLQSEYERLVLPRRIRLIKELGETRSPHSVLATEFNRMRFWTILRPIWAGADTEENLRSHLSLLKRQQLKNVFFLLDLGQPWQSCFTPSLLHLGFAPRMILPYAGEADLVLFQLEGAGS